MAKVLKVELTVLKPTPHFLTWVKKNCAVYIPTVAKGKLVAVTIPDFKLGSYELKFKRMPGDAANLKAIARDKAAVSKVLEKVDAVLSKKVKVVYSR